MPNAFTFGRIQADASIVVTKGLLEALTPEEVNAVLSSETGRIKHWDFLTMTAASIVPLLLYHRYRESWRPCRCRHLSFESFSGWPKLQSGCHPR